MKKAKNRPKTLEVLERREASTFTLVSPPSSSVLRKCANLFGSNGEMNIPPILETKDPLKLLKKSSRVVTFVKRIKGTNDDLIKDLLCFIIEHGGLIKTNDPRRKFVFDQARMGKLCLISSQGMSAIPEYDRRARLYDLLNIKEASSEIDEIITEEEETETLSPDEISTYVEIVMDERLNGLTSSFVELRELPQLLGQLAVHSVNGREDGITDVLADVARLVHSLRDHIETDALDILEDLQSSVPAPISESSSLPTIESQIREILERKKPLEAIIQLITPFKREADMAIETIEFTIIGQDLQVRLDAAKKSDSTAEDVPLLEGAIARAEEKQAEIEDYSDQLTDLLSPIKAEIDQLNRRKMALMILSKPLEVKTFEMPELPVFPKFDEEDLLQWRDSLLEEDAPDEADNSPSLPQKTEVITPDDLRGQNARVVLATFGLLAKKRQRTSFKVARVLHEMGLLAEKVNVCIGIVQGVCTSNSDPANKSNYLKRNGSVGGQFPTYKATNELPIKWTDEVFSKDQQTYLLQAFVKKPKPTK